MKNLYEILKITDEYISYLKENGVEFNEKGFPILKKEYFLLDEPDMIIPYSHRNDKRVLDKRKTVLCTFTSDREIYPRLKNIFLELNIYKQYMGVVTSDLTVTEDMDEEWQDFIILLNQLYGAVLAINGIKILFNTRVGCINNLKLWTDVPKGVTCISSFLGCKKNNIYDYSYLSKILFLLPSKLYIYGKEDIIINKMLDTMGINYKYFDDFHRICRKEIKNGR